MRKQREDNQNDPRRVPGKTVLPETTTTPPGTKAGVSAVTRRLPVVIAAGRGLKDTEGLSLLYMFADRLREEIRHKTGSVDSGRDTSAVTAPAAVSDPVLVVATRGAVEEGLMDVSEMVGMSGRRVTAGLYIAVGVSGSNFHTAGIKGDPFIVAVNPDPKARIHELADCSIYRDCKEVLQEWHQPQRLISLLT